MNIKQTEGRKRQVERQRAAHRRRKEAKEAAKKGAK